VRDTGIGMTQEVLPRIFDLFVQEEQSLDRSRGGLGIGLTIVRSLVEQHGGSVSAWSDGAGKGSELSVSLPRTSRGAAAAEAAPVALASVPSQLRPVRILVVDDYVDSAEMLAEILGGMGYDTRMAHDAARALKIAAEFMPTLVFLDIGLPVMDGYELAEHLRQLPGLAGVRLIALTGYGQESDRKKTREAGFHHHLVKPVDMSAIELAVKTQALASAS